MYWSGCKNYDKLIGFIRLRLDSNPGGGFIKELSHCSLVRELHVYGHTKGIGEKTFNDKKAQHKGYGKILLSMAEVISYEHGYRKIAVLSAVGTRNYYKLKAGYTEMIDRYNVKKLTYLNDVKNKIKLIIWNADLNLILGFLIMFLIISNLFIYLLNNTK